MQYCCAPHRAQGAVNIFIHTYIFSIHTYICHFLNNILYFNYIKKTFVVNRKVIRIHTYTYIYMMLKSWVGVLTSCFESATSCDCSWGSQRSGRAIPARPLRLVPALITIRRLFSLRRPPLPLWCVFKKFIYSMYVCMYMYMFMFACICSF